MPSSGGEEVKISEAGAQGRWAIGTRGVYFLSAGNELEFQEFSTRRCIRIPTPRLQLGGGVTNTIGAGPNDRWILLTVLVRSEVHLRLVRNFE